MNKRLIALAAGLITLLLFTGFLCEAQGGKNQKESTGSIPLSEHPRPDWQRKHWMNLNGTWAFEFDSANKGERENWFSSHTAFTKKITVPFPWGSPLSNVKSEAHIAWYARSITVPQGWKNQRIFLVVGASDWHTTAWVNGKKLGSHKGGYTPFEFDITDHITFGQPQKLVLKADDTPHDFKITGKQGYGEAKGIWQTVYLEARPPVALQTIHFSPDIDNGLVKVAVTVTKPSTGAAVTLTIATPQKPIVRTEHFAAGELKKDFIVTIPQARLWSLNDPYLYNVTATLTDGAQPKDEVHTYFGMRKISVMNLPGIGIPYIALNNQPVYLQLALDQAYHPDGFYTYPSDAFMQQEIRRAKSIGLNGLRIHIKAELPRKLYWADKEGLLIMQDVPNSWGEPSVPMQQETETALRGIIRRDYNHPSVFSWIVFNETWGLFTNEGTKKVYKPETQQWVRAMYRLAKSLDPTRLVEDNSTNNGDHVETDINSWHTYQPGYRWKAVLDDVSSKIFPGSQWNFSKGHVQQQQPVINSECGNVWGYNGSTGDVDWSWDYHIMINEFRSHPKIAGWLYTEMYDVINEWNGYFRYDRSEKFAGLSDLMPGMKLKDLHSLVYLSIGDSLCKTVEPAEKTTVPLWLSVMTDKYNGRDAFIQYELVLYDRLGGEQIIATSKEANIQLQAWQSEKLEPLVVRMPQQPGLAVLRVLLKDKDGVVLHRNFTTFVVGKAPSPRDERLLVNGENIRVLRFDPAGFTKQQWSGKQWHVLNGVKVAGAGAGYFEYEVHLPKDLDVTKIKNAVFKMEASAKALLGKDKSELQIKEEEADVVRGGGQPDNGRNPNAYPMTDTKRFQSKVHILMNGEEVGAAMLDDDPADHRGVLSWQAQPKDGTLHEAGSYGYLIKTTIPLPLLRNAKETGKLVIQLKVAAALPGGLAIYGERFGRYPVDPMLVFKLAD